MRGARPRPAGHEPRRGRREPLHGDDLPRRLAAPQGAGRTRTPPPLRGHPKGEGNQRGAEIPRTGAQARRGIRERRRAEVQSIPCPLVHHRHAAHGALHPVQHAHLPSLSPLHRAGGYRRVLHRRGIHRRYPLSRYIPHDGARAGDGDGADGARRDRHHRHGRDRHEPLPREGRYGHCSKENASRQGRRPNRRA